MNEERQGAEEAEGLLESLVGFDSLPIKPEEVAEELNDKNFELIYEKQPFNSEKLLGKAIGNTRKAIIYINQNIEDRGRSNFTAAHEIGHVCLHIMPGDYEEFSCGTQQLYNPYNDPVEKQANGFASGLLMPRVLLKEISDGDINWQNIDRIKKTCLASYEATFRRMISLEKDPAALVIHKDGNFRRFVASDSFDAFILKDRMSWDQLSLCTDISHEEFPLDFDEVDASEWVNPRIGTEKLHIIYASSIRFKDGYTYTLLRYDDGCLEN